MAEDEEHLTESRTIPAMKIATPPPAYGLWRSSVVSGYAMSDNDNREHTTNLRAETKSRLALLATCRQLPRYFRH